MKNIIVGIVIVAVGILLFVTMRAKKPEPIAQQNMEQTDSSKTENKIMDEKISVQVNQSEEKIVRYTNEGFEPKTLEISVGTKVTFINETTSGMWTASAPHPAHTNLPGFDALRNMNKGESYSYTFTKAGTWAYHNHTSAGKFGKIIVN